jgi:hypothetical protein
VISSPPGAIFGGNSRTIREHHRNQTGARPSGNRMALLGALGQRRFQMIALITSHSIAKARGVFETRSCAGTTDRRCDHSEGRQGHPENASCKRLGKGRKRSQNDRESRDYAIEMIGDPCRARTCDNLLRRQVLYPAELRGRLEEVSPLVPAVRDQCVQGCVRLNRKLSL